MNLRFIHRINKAFLLVLMGWAGMLVSCTDQLEEVRPGDSDGSEDKSKGEMILFAAGTTTNSVNTRADGDGGDDSPGSTFTETPGKTYYMPTGYRFVCRMYYRASTGENAKFDVSGGTDVISWFKVKGDVGNSLYWRNSFPTLDESKEELFDTYGNDAEATCFYWQNRKAHAFLAWTDLNKAPTIGYNPTKNSGTLKFVPEDETYVKHTGEKQSQWVFGGYEVNLKNGSTEIFADMAAIRKYLETGDNSQNISNSKPADADFTDQQYYYQFGWSCKYRMQKGAGYETVDEAHRKYGWYEYQMFYNKLKYEGETTVGGNIVIRNNAKGEPAYLFNTATNKFLAEIDIKYYKLDNEGKLTDVEYKVTTSSINVRTTKVVSNQEVQNGDKIKEGDTLVAQCVFEYNQTDEYGNVKYDENTPRYTFYYKELLENKEIEITKELAANVFDLTRKDGMTSIKDQPDIVQALTIQAPLGATQSANRVNLYFKHQFSMVQVNVKSSADLSVTIDKKHIKKVELLGVTEKGYVFTEMDEDGKVEPATYASVDVSKYDDEHLKDNQYGTAFNMFDMATGKDENGQDIPENDTKTHDAGYATGYIKSYNALTFGKLQAIRVIWTEEADSGVEHKSTYTVADEVLKNLKSGYKYVWNIELRRGTLAIVRTEIVDWIVPTEELEYNTNGTIYN